MNAKGDTSDESYGDIKNGGTLTADKNLWVLGNYSRFIRPGYKRVDVSGADEMNALMASSWLSADGNTLVTVLVNMNRISRNIALSLDSQSVQSVKTYVTDKDRDLELDSSLSDVSDMDIPARSVVTVVTTLGTASGISTAKTETTKGNNKIYALDGRQLSHPQKGIIIKNGKKFVVK